MQVLCTFVITCLWYLGQPMTISNYSNCLLFNLTGDIQWTRDDEGAHNCINLNNNIDMSSIELL